MHRVKYFNSWKRGPPSKYKSSSCYCLSDHFHRSGLEGKVCDELRLRKIAKDIKDYRREVSITLMEGEVNVSSYIGKYIADFFIDHNDGTTEIMEAKGIEFPMFRKKWRALEKMYANDPTMTLTIVRK